MAVGSPPNSVEAVGQVVDPAWRAEVPGQVVELAGWVDEALEPLGLLAGSPEVAGQAVELAMWVLEALGPLGLLSASAEVAGQAVELARWVPETLGPLGAPAVLVAPQPPGGRAYPP